MPEKSPSDRFFSKDFAGSVSWSSKGCFNLSRTKRGPNTNYPRYESHRNHHPARHRGQRRHRAHDLQSESRGRPRVHPAHPQGGRKPGHLRSRDRPGAAGFGGAARPGRQGRFLNPGAKLSQRSGEQMAPVEPFRRPGNRIPLGLSGRQSRGETGQDRAFRLRPRRTGAGPDHRGGWQAAFPASRRSALSRARRRIDPAADSRLGDPQRAGREVRSATFLPEQRLQLGGRLQPGRSGEGRNRHSNWMGDRCQQQRNRFQTSQGETGGGRCEHHQGAPRK